jgi:hypothetical protein
MDKKPDIDLTKSALRLKEIDKLVIKTSIEGSIKELLKLLDEFRCLKKTIKISLINTSIPKVDNKEAQIIMKKIVNEQVFEADRIITNLENISGLEFNVNHLELEETEQLESDLFYSWFSGNDYINGLYEIGTLILGVSVPKILMDFVREAKECFAFQQYNALYSLCRTIIEASIRDICKRKGLIKEKDRNVIIFEHYQKDNISQLINNISSGDLKRTIKDIYYNKSSFLIHGHKTAKRTEAKILFRETMAAIQKLYARNGY